MIGAVPAGDSERQAPNEARQVGPRLVQCIAALALALAGCSYLVPLDGLTGGSGPRDGADGRVVVCNAANLTNDPDNCGACGHSCMGGDCQKSACLPVTIATNQGRPLGIFVRSDWVFWVNQDRPSVIRARKDGSVINPIVGPADLVHNPFDVVADDTLVYWTQGCPAGSPPTCSADAVVLKKEINGGPPAVYMPGRGYLAIDGSDVYAADYLPTGMRGSIVTKTSALYIETETLAGLAVQSGLLFWIRQTSQQIVSGKVTGGLDISLIVRTSGRSQGVAADGNSVYWIEDSRRVMRAPIRVVALPVALYDAPEAFGDCDIAVDNESIFWTENTTGLVRRLAK
jgi:hypothetical protein